METALKKIATILNSCPLTAHFHHKDGAGQEKTSLQPDHKEPLTPNHLLIGHASLKPVHEEATLEMETTGRRLAYLRGIAKNFLQGGLGGGLILFSRY